MTASMRKVLPAICHFVWQRSTRTQNAARTFEREWFKAQSVQRRLYRASSKAERGKRQRGKNLAARGTVEGPRLDGSRTASERNPREADNDNEEDDGIVFQEEDEDDMADFLEEYEEAGLELPGQQESEGDPEIVETLTVEDCKDGKPRTKVASRQSPKTEESISTLLSRARQVGAMTEDEWFQYLSHKGMQQDIAADIFDEEGIKGEPTMKPLRKGKTKQSLKQRPFVDRTRISVTGGRGGKGCISFEAAGPGRAKKPSGGHGGAGGHIFFVADPGKQTLDFDRHHYNGKDGANGNSDQRRGAQGNETFVHVPCGTVIREVQHYLDVDGRYRVKRREVCDLDEPMSYFKAASGGDPGLGNYIQAGRSRRQHVNAFHLPGNPGEQRVFDLELKTIADVGLVGYPNAGKSTLLGKLSGARPKVASYAFTTLSPMVGFVRYQDLTSITVADLPGLIEGAYANKGLGHEFLRHIERTKVLLYVLDAIGPAAGLQAAADCSTALAEEPADVVYAKLKKELERYAPGLSERPSALLLNKADVDWQIAEHSRQAILPLLDEGTPVVLGSGLTGLGMGQVAAALRMKMEEAMSGTLQEALEEQSHCTKNE